MSDYSVMPSFSEHMEDMNSAHTLLSSRGGSEIGSRYQMESGLYISSFAATIFVAAIVTIGVLFITLVATLTVMLQSCQTSSAGLVEFRERSDQYNYCSMLALHAELNKLEIDEFPSICKAHTIQYVKEVQYLRDLNWTVWMVNNYFNSLKPQADGLDVVLLDVDDILTSNNLDHISSLQYRFNLYEESNQIENDKLQAGLRMLDLISKLQASGWSLILITTKPQTLRNVTIETLISSGYRNWSSLIMRSDNEVLIESWEYFARRRAELQNLGYRIISVISSHMDALTGPCLGKHVFKLPSLLNYKLKDHVNSL